MAVLSALDSRLSTHPSYGDVRDKRLKALHQMIGHTPLLALHMRWRGETRTVYAKAEHYNLTGSIKDRMALHVLEKGVKRGALKPGARVIEATSGNSGIATAAIARALGHPVRIFMPDKMSQERKALIASLGAELVLVSEEEGGAIGAREMCERLGASSDMIFGPCQFSNPDNCEAHAQTTGPELIAQLARLGLKPDGFVAGVGTGGTIMGVGTALRQRFPEVRLHPVQPAESPTLTAGKKIGQHRIQGMTDDFIPEILDLDRLDAVISVSDGDGIIMAQRLARELGLGVGISSGVNLLAALKVQDEIGANAVVATVFCDDNKKYLSTDLGREEPVKPGYLSPEIELLGFDAVSAKP